MTNQDRYRIVFWLILLSAALLYSCVNLQFRTGAFGDDAVYVVVARDLRNLYASHILPAIKPDYPLPGLPLILAPWATLVAPHWISLEWIAVLMTLLSIVLLEKWIRTWLSPAETLIVVGLYAFNPSVVRFSGILMPTVFYATAVIGSFFLMSRVLESPTTPRTMALGILLGWASLIRVEGVVVLICIGFGLLGSQKRREVWGILAIPLAFWCAFALYWFHRGRFPHSEFGGDFLSLLQYWPSHSSEMVRFAAELLKVLFVNTLAALRFPALPLSFWARAILVVLGMGTCLTGFRALWGENIPNRIVLLSALAFCGIYFLIHVFWHVAIPRYCVPLVPLALIFLVHGISDRLSTIPAKKVWITSIILLLLIPYSYRNGYAVYESLWSPDPMKSPPWQSLSWIRQNTAPSAKMVSKIAPSIVLYTKRYATEFVPAQNLEMFLSQCLTKHITYFVDRPGRSVAPGIGQTGDPNPYWKRVHLWAEYYPSRFPLAFYDPIEKSAIFSIQPEKDFLAAYQKYLAAQEELKVGRVESALSDATESLSLDPKFGPAFHLMGIIYLFKHDLVHAEGSFLKAVSLMPDSSASMLNLAAIYHAENRNKDALSYLEKAHELSLAIGDEKNFVEKSHQIEEFWKKSHEIPFFYLS